MAAAERAWRPLGGLALWLIAAEPAVAVSRRQTDPVALMWTLGAMAAIGLGVVGWLLLARGERLNRRAEAGALMGRLRERDAAWDPEAFKARVRTVFQGVFPLSEPGDVDSIAHLVTPAFSDRLAERLTALYKQGRRRRADRADIQAIEAVHVDDRLDDTQDRAWAFIHFFGDEHELHAETGRPIEDAGRVNALGHKQIWKFVRQGDTWLLEDIAPDATHAVFDARVRTESPELDP